VDTVTNLVVAYNTGIPSQAEELLASQEVPSSIELVREVLNDGHVYCVQITNSAVLLLCLRWDSTLQACCCTVVRVTCTFIPSVPVIILWPLVPGGTTCPYSSSYYFVPDCGRGAVIESRNYAGRQCDSVEVVELKLWKAKRQ